MAEQPVARPGWPIDQARPDKRRGVGVLGRPSDAFDVMVRRAALERLARQGGVVEPDLPPITRIPTVGGQPWWWAQQGPHVGFLPPFDRRIAK